MTAKRITDEQRDSVIAMCRDGKSRNAIARAIGISTGSVSAIIRDAGMSFDRDTVKAATEARKADIAELRSRLELDYVLDAQRLRQLMWQPMTYRELGSFADEGVGGAKFSRFVEHTQDTPTPQDQERLMRASINAASASQRIADAASDAGTEAAKSMLAKLGEALGTAWREEQAREAAEESAPA